MYLVRLTLVGILLAGVAAGGAAEAMGLGLIGTQPPDLGERLISAASRITDRLPAPFHDRKRQTPRNELISDGQFVYGPNAEGFDLQQFLLERGSPLAPYWQDIEAAARYTSVNPKVLLTLLEVRDGWVTAAPELEPEAIRERIERTAFQLAIPFYEHLYRWGSRAGKHSAVPKAPPTLQFEEGEAYSLDRALSSGTYALASALAEGLSLENWQAQVAPKSGGFAQTFSALFPDTDPLDASNSINPPSLPPEDFFQLPFPLGADWQFNGPHSWCGGDSCYNEPPDRSSMDFSTNWKRGAPWPDHYTVASHGGEGRIRVPYSGRSPCWYEVDHGDGWKTSYYHLRYLGDPGTEGAVTRNQRLGAIGEEVCNGGFADGAHVHFTLWYNGAYYDLDGIKLSGWEVQSGPEPYTTGTLEREGVVLEPYDTVRNDYHEYYATGADYALQFNGNGAGGVDRVILEIDDPETAYPGPPADVGFHDFVIEWWMMAKPGKNAAPAIQCGANDNWKQGNVLVDRSRSTEGSEIGVSMAGGVIAFGVEGDGTGALTLCSTSRVDDGQWHHIAVQRNRWAGTYADGEMWLFVDGVLEARGVGPGLDVSYPDEAVPGERCGPSGSDPCTQDSYLYLGGSKWDAGESFSGAIDDLRISWWLRYFTDFTPPDGPHLQDSKTVALFRFNEGDGDAVLDVGGYDGGTSNGLRVYGGDPPGPEWVHSALQPWRWFYFPRISR
jgi:LasA protease